MKFSREVNQEIFLLLMAHTFAEVFAAHYGTNWSHRITKIREQGKHTAGKGLNQVQGRGTRSQRCEAISKFRTTPSPALQTLYQFLVFQLKINRAPSYPCYCCDGGSPCIFSEFFSFSK